MIYPIGRQNFENLRNDSCVYVDKTALMYKLVKKGCAYFDIEALSNHIASEDQLNSIHVDDIDPIPVLYQSGYLTITEYDSRFALYTLDYPNEEVKSGFINFLLPFYSKVKEKQTHSIISKFVTAIERGKAEDFMQQLQSLMAGTPYELVKGEKIQIFNYGNCKRDFTYVDDIVEGVIRVMQHAPEKANGEDGLPIPPYKVYNIGNNQPENLLDFVTILQEELLRAGVLPQNYDFEAHKELVPMQPGDVPIRYADTTPLEEDFGFKPSTSLRDGLRAFAEWYAEYYKN